VSTEAIRQIERANAQFLCDFSAHIEPADGQHQRGDMAAASISLAGFTGAAPVLAQSLIQDLRAMCRRGIFRSFLL
jgi:hypothetical protein